LKRASRFRSAVTTQFQLKNWSVTPQAQLVYSNMDFDSFRDIFDASVSLSAVKACKGGLNGTRVVVAGNTKVLSRNIRRSSLLGRWSKRKDKPKWKDDIQSRRSIPSTNPCPVTQKR